MQPLPPHMVQLGRAHAAHQHQRQNPTAYAGRREPSQPAPFNPSALRMPNVYDYFGAERIPHVALAFEEVGTYFWLVRAQ